MDFSAKWDNDEHESSQSSTKAPCGEMIPSSCGPLANARAQWRSCRDVAPSELKMTTVHVAGIQHVVRRRCPIPDHGQFPSVDLCRIVLDQAIFPLSLVGSRPTDSPKQTAYSVGGGRCGASVQSGCDPRRAQRQSAPAHRVTGGRLR